MLLTVVGAFKERGDRDRGVNSFAFLLDRGAQEGVQREVREAGAER
jgi:hypothetical protein